MHTIRLPRGKTLHLKQGDITAESTDAIVNPANGHLRHGGGAALAIARAGGSVIQQQSQDLIRKIGILPVSHAVITDGGLLPAKFVIHTVGPQWGEGDEERKLRQAVENVLFLGHLYNLRSVSMPAISSGIFGFPKDRCAQILLETVIDFFLRLDTPLESVTFCNHDTETCQHFLHAATAAKLIDS
jgi:O-acetyl-ADP-ribose deacetylase (regulator of RNase III)